MNKTAWASLAVTMAVVSIYSLYKVFKNGKKNPPLRPPLSTDRKTIEHSQEQDFQDRIPYQNQISDPQKYSLILQKPELDTSIQQLSYQLILNINKGTNYEGVVKIKIISHGKLGNKRNLPIDFAGNQILHVRVNGKKLEQKQVRYERHVIWLKKQYLQQSQNEIEIIFANRYAFMGNGLTVYFPLDQKTNKYSLKKQIVYSRNGVYQAPRIMPCLNVLNQCKISVEMLHADGFDAYSNAPKSLYRSVSKQDYPCYTFMFQASQKKLNRSFQINTSGGYSENNSSFLSFDDIIKENTQFYEHKLDSIHDLFLFCGKITQVRPSLQKSQKCPLLLRYFVREHLTGKAVALLNILQCQITDIYNRLENYRKMINQEEEGSPNNDSIHKHINLKPFHKVDVFFVDDINGQSDFHKGSLLLNQKTIERGVIDRRIYYLICRAFVGMGIPKHNVMLALNGKLQLNQLTLKIFPECSDFIFLKQLEYKLIKKNCLQLLQFKQQQAEQLWAQEFYEKQCKYFVRDENLDKKSVSTAIVKLVENFDTCKNQQYWNKFISAYPFLEATSAQILIKVSLKEKGVPINEEHLLYAKQNFIKSKYYIKFLTNLQIQNDLDKYISCYGVQYRLPYIKVKAKFSELISEHNDEKYLKLKSNRLQSHNLYQQFKRFNEQRSFHHYTIITDEIKRIKTLAEDKIKDERKNLQCGLMGWKLLSKLKIYPGDQETYRLIIKLLRMKGKVIQEISL